MKRKIMKIADTTFVVSIPLKWAREYGVKKGDEIELITNANQLQLTYKPRNFTKEALIDLDKLTTKNYTKAAIVNAYRKGYDQINLKITNSGQLIFIKEALSELIGVEIIEQDDKKIILRNIADEQESQFENMMRRSFLVLLTLTDTIFDELKASKIDLDKYKEMSKTIKKLSNVCKRILNVKQLYGENTLYYYMIVREIEKLCNEYFYLINYAKDTNLKSKTTIDLLQETNILLRKMYEIFYKKDFIEINKVSREKDRLLWGKTYSLLGKGDDAVILHHIGSIIRRIFDMHGPMLAISQTWNLHE